MRTLGTKIEWCTKNSLNIRGSIPSSLLSASKSSGNSSRFPLPFSQEKAIVRSSLEKFHIITDRRLPVNSITYLTRKGGTL